MTSNLLLEILQMTSFLPGQERKLLFSMPWIALTYFPYSLCKDVKDLGISIFYFGMSTHCISFRLLPSDESKQLVSGKLKLLSYQDRRGKWCSAWLGCIDTFSLLSHYARVSGDWGLTYSTKEQTQQRLGLKLVLNNHRFFLVLHFL